MAIPRRGSRAGPSAALRGGTDGRGRRPADWQSSAAPEPAHDGPQGSWARLLLPAAAIAVALGLVVVAPGTWSRSRPGTSPHVEVDVEAVVVRALAVDGAARAVVSAAGSRSDLFALPGAGAAATAVSHAADGLEAALLADVPAPLPAVAAAYLRAPGHAALLAEARALAALATTAGFLDSVHGSVFGGSGQVLAHDAQARLAGEVLAAGTGGPLQRWAEALLAAYDGVASSQEAGAARAEVVATWQARVATLRPAAEPELLELLAAVEPATLEALRAHPVAGPSLAALRPPAEGR